MILYSTILILSDVIQGRIQSNGKARKGSAPKKSRAQPSPIREGCG